MPPIIGAAIRVATSAPVAMGHVIGINPRNMVATVVDGYDLYAGRQTRLDLLDFCTDNLRC